MPPELPAPVAAYFAADSGDGDAVARCFTEQAVVRDEGRTYTGRAAIAAWKTASSAQYHYASEPFAIEARGGRIVVTSHVVGDFPGSPVDLRYAFVVKGDKVASLEISP